jgi:hypothetical protein
MAIVLSNQTQTYSIMPRNAKAGSIVLREQGFQSGLFFYFSESAQNQGGYVFPELLASFR